MLLVNDLRPGVLIRWVYPGHRVPAEYEIFLVTKIIGSSPSGEVNFEAWSLSRNKIDRDLALGPNRAYWFLEDELQENNQDDLAR